MWIILTTTKAVKSNSFRLGAISVISTLIAEFQVKNYITHNPEESSTNLKAAITLEMSSKLTVHFHKALWMM